MQAFFNNIIAGSSDLYPNRQLPGDPTIIVHTSLSAFGVVHGGASHLVQMLLRAARLRHITIVMPAHQDNEYTGIAKRASCKGMGICAETFRTRAGVLRSAHPQLSFCAKGPRARHIIKNHKNETGTGFKSPAGALYREDALVLMLGTGYETCTVLHLAEYISAASIRLAGGIPDMVTCGAMAKKSILGGRHWNSWEDIRYHSEHFPALGKAFENTWPDHWQGGRLPSPQVIPTDIENSSIDVTGAWKLFRVRDIVNFSTGLLESGYRNP